MRYTFPTLARRFLLVPFLLALAVSGLIMQPQVAYAASCRDLPADRATECCQRDPTADGCTQPTPANPSANCTTKDSSGNDVPGVGTGIKINGVNCVPIGQGGSLQANPIFAFMTAILKFLSAAVGLAVVGGIVWGGLLYLTARGSAAQTQQGITVITNSTIGLILFILMVAIMNYLVPGAIFSALGSGMEHIV